MITIKQGKTKIDTPKEKYFGVIVAAQIFIDNSSPLIIDPLSIESGCAHATMWKESTHKINNQFAYSLN